MPDKNNWVLLCSNNGLFVFSKHCKFDGKYAGNMCNLQKLVVMDLVVKQDAVFILGRIIASLALIFSLGRENRQTLGPYRHKRKIGDTQRPETLCAVQTSKTDYQ